MSVDDCILFEHFVKLLHSISQVQPRRESSTTNSRSLELVNRWFTLLRRYYFVIPPHTCKIFFRLFFPEEDVRRRYNVKETVLSRTLATDVFGLSRNPRGVDGCSLVQWSEYTGAADNARQGCLGVEVERALLDRCSARDGKSPSLQKIDALLDELAGLSSYSDLGDRQPRPQRARASILRDIYLDLDPLEAKFITQIILKDLRPVLYPLTETQTTKALLHYKGNALHVLSKWEVMSAWRPCMPRIYRVRATLDEAARAVEALPSMEQIPSDHEVFLPVLGIPIEVPKSQKGVKLTHSLNFFQDEGEVWAETKYDGERMQIHVDLSMPLSQQITIFSKSKRNSTQDRIGTHPIIRASLGLAPFADDYVQYPGLRERAGSVRNTVTCSAILDAEMVCYSESQGDIDEFWRIRSLVESTACGVRSRQPTNRKVRVSESQSQDSTQSGSENHPEVITESLQSNASDNGDRHLKVVFFDLMFLNGRSLLDQGYHERRAQLEQIVNIVPGYISLSCREPIDMSRGISTAVKDLVNIFSQHIAGHKEGLVLKGSKSTYNNHQQPWVKLKRDYIPGYGDTVDLIILAAGWNKARARELRVAPETFTTFFVAALDGRDSPWSEDKVPSTLPHFQILFTVEYGMDRAQLETLNLYIKTCEPQVFKDRMSNLSYSFRLPTGLSKPAVMFSRPLLGELFGAGFSKDPGAMHYSLRFPRLTKVWRDIERSWTAGSPLEDFQKIARMSIGRESSDEWASRNVDSLWGYTVNQGPKDPRNVAETMRVWYEKLSRLEGLTTKNGTAMYASDHGTTGFSRSKRKIIPTDIQESAKRRKLHSTRIAALPSRTLGSMTNVPRDNLTQRQRNTLAVASVASTTAAVVLFNNQYDLPGEKADKVVKKFIATHDMPITPMSPDERNTSQKEVVTGLASLDMPFTFCTSINDVQPRTLATSNSNIQSIHINQQSSSLGFQSLDVVTLVSPKSFAEVDSLQRSHMLPSQAPGMSWPQHYANTPISQFIRDSYVWIYRDVNNRRPADRPPASHLFPQHRRIGVIYFLLIICGCRVEVGKTVCFRTSEQFTHVNKCVMFVKTGNGLEVKEGLNWLFRALESWRTELNKPGNKELFVFDSQMITYTSLSSFCGDVASKALWRSGRRVEPNSA